MVLPWASRISQRHPWLGHELSWHGTAVGLPLAFMGRRDTTMAFHGRSWRYDTGMALLIVVDCHDSAVRVS